MHTGVEAVLGMATRHSLEIVKDWGVADRNGHRRLEPNPPS
jgi:hypothetical protein